jgi:hypothetical protein
MITSVHSPVVKSLVIDAHCEDSCGESVPINFLYLLPRYQCQHNWIPRRMAWLLDVKLPVG